ncbi:MAG: type II secretion system minor pseudopilin GspI [Magnetococcales bacterium]|nr:type II secretion system minor pseudopilin GspI [Magnetococcales bacterium]
MGMTRAPGFTLLEVLVAMALLGLLLVGVGAVLERQARAQYLLEEKLAAAQVSSNLMEQFRLEGASPTPESRSGSMEMAGRAWEWRLHVAKTAEKNGHEVTIRVGPEAAPLFEERMQW